MVTRATGRLATALVQLGRATAPQATTTTLAAAGADAARGAEGLPGPRPPAGGNTALAGRAALPGAAPAAGAMRRFGSSAHHPLQNELDSARRQLEDAFRHGNMDLLDQCGFALSGLACEGLSPAQRLQLTQQLDGVIALGNDAAQLLEAVFDGASDLPALMQGLGIDSATQQRLSHPPEALPEHCQAALSPAECTALSLYGVREPALASGSMVFRAVNTTLRLQLQPARTRLDFLIAPLVSGMGKLPALDGQRLARGLQIAPAGDAALLQAFASQHTPGTVLTLPAVQTGSRRGPYPGDVVMRMRAAASGSNLRDTSHFNHTGPAQREAGFLPGTRFVVTAAEQTQVQAAWSANDGAMASSGRTWAQRLNSAVLILDLEEQPAAPAR